MRAPERGTLPVVEQFVDDQDPTYYGRYRLSFDQIAPWRDDGRVLIKVRSDETAALDAVIAGLEPRQSWPFQRVNQGKDGQSWSFQRGAPDDDFLSLEQLSDVSYIDMRNLRLAVARLGPHLDDARFFVFSMGDGLDRWVDEYRIADRVVEAGRWLWEPDRRSALYRALLSKARR